MTIHMAQVVHLDSDEVTNGGWQQASSLLSLDFSHHTKKPLGISISMGENKKNGGQLSQLWEAE